MFPIAAILVAVSWGSDALAAAGWQKSPYAYVVVDQELHAVLTEFGRNLNIPVKISGALKGQRIRGAVNDKPDGSAGEFLRNLADTYGLVWFYDGTVLNIAEASEVGTEIVPVKKAKIREIEKQLSALVDVSHPEINVRAAPNGNALAISGPPSYRSFVRTTVAGMFKRDGSRVAREEALGDHAAVRVFRGGS